VRAPLSAGLLAGALLCASSALGQSRWEDDAPIPYSDDPEAEDTRPRDRTGARKLPGRSDATADLREESDWEQEERAQRLSGIDDPHLGVGAEVTSGALLLSSSQGELVAPAFALGARVNWEVGRLLPSPPWNESLFVDLAWTFGRQSEGTERIFGRSHYHYFTVAPAYQFSVDQKRQYGFYLQAGGGLAYQFAGITSDGQETTIAGLKPLFQYGVGFRGGPELSPGGVRLSFRAEVTRFRRGYLNDTLLAASVGAAF
jgi:hypothetical protein